MIDSIAHNKVTYNLLSDVDVDSIVPHTVESTEDREAIERGWGGPPGRGCWYVWYRLPVFFYKKGCQACTQSHIKVERCTQC